jgi:hypothetical protein
MDIMPATVANMVAFFAPRVSLESHLCFGAEVIVDAVVSIAVSATAEMFIVSIGKKVSLKNKVKMSAASTDYFFFGFFAV